MTKDHLKFLYIESSVRQIQDVLKSGHSAFPVMNTQNNMVGMIKARFLAVLLKNKIWSDVASEGQHKNKSMTSFYSPQAPKMNKSYSMTQINNDSSPFRDSNKDSSNKSSYE